MSSPTLVSDRARPLHEDPRIHGRRWFLLAMMCLSLVLVVMSVSGLVTAIPTMQEELHASASQIQWILDAYAIVFAGALLTAGALGDRFGRKRALLFGLVVFAAGALVAGLASTAGQVIAGRAVNKNDMICVADSQSTPSNNPGFKQGIRIGSVKDGKVTAFIPEPRPARRKASASMTPAMSMLAGPPRWPCGVTCGSRRAVDCVHHPLT